jgi:hypothetical protein
METEHLFSVSGKGTIYNSVTGTRASTVHKDKSERYKKKRQHTSFFIAFTVSHMKM